MAFSLVWSFGLIISIMIFAISAGLILSREATNNKNLIIFLLASTGVIFILVYLIDLAKTQISSLMGSYSYILLFLISFILMLIGYSIIKNKKLVFKRTILLSYACFMVTVVMCVGSEEPLFGLNSLQISLLTTILFNLIMGIAFFMCKKWNLLNTSYKTFGSMFFILGLYCLMVSLLLPNILSLNMGDMRPINIVSMENVALTIAALIVVVILGCFYYKKNTLLK
jgi:predicted transporter